MVHAMQLAQLLTPARLARLPDELDAWLGDIRPQVERGSFTFERRHLDDADEQIAIISNAVAHNDIDRFLAVSMAATRATLSNRRPLRAPIPHCPGTLARLCISPGKPGARADSALPGDPGTLMHLRGDPGLRTMTKAKLGIIPERCDL